MDGPPPLPPRVRWLLGVAGVLAALGFAWFVRQMVTGKDAKPARQVQTITMIRPPPPPPVDQPPPPPPPDQPHEQLPQNEPEPSPSDAAAPAEQLGLDAEGAAGGDGFGLAARKGGHDLVGSGGAVFGWYTARLKDRVAEKLAGESRLRSRKYVVSLRIWIESDGRIRDVHVISGTGSGDLDAIIRSAVASIGALAESPPLEMPEPVTIRIVSRTG
ncbi:MAG: TonB C-terminal domain-containing protein [Proteobacteria bacterium]|nr:TonB C-terminal domain-containing protein [Pseudomonadota bacterium]